VKNGMMKIGFSRPVAHSTRTDAICVISLWSLPPRRGKIKIGVPIKIKLTPSFLLPLKGKEIELRRSFLDGNGREQLGQRN
jgi:hypothetical protein